MAGDYECTLWVCLALGKEELVFSPTWTNQPATAEGILRCIDDWVGPRLASVVPGPDSYVYVGLYCPADAQGRGSFEVTPELSASLASRSLNLWLSATWDEA